MDSKTFQIPAILVKANPTKDNSMSLGFHTNELSHEEKVMLMEKLNSFGWLLFRENAFEAKDIPKENAEIGGKTPSQRLRNVLFVLWTERGSEGDFEAFYRARMESLIEQYKSKLPQ